MHKVIFYSLMEMKRTTKCYFDVSKSHSLSWKQPHPIPFRLLELCYKEISPKANDLAIKQKVLFWHLVCQVLGSEGKRNSKCLEICRAIPLKYMPREVLCDKSVTDKLQMKTELNLVEFLCM